MILKPNTGIDISDYQPGMQIGSLLPLPRFVIIKATENILYKAKLTSDFAAQCRTLGVPYGFYHFWQNTDPVRQANNYITQVNAAGGFERIPPVLDLEVANLAPYSANIKTWLDVVEDVAGMRPILYSNKYHFDMIAGNTWFKNYDVWTAAYPTDPDLWSWCPPLYSEKRARREIIWQYGSTYRYPNYSANSVDTNIAITEWLNEIGAITQPPPQNGATMYEGTAKTTATPNVRLRQANADGTANPAGTTIGAIQPGQAFKADLLSPDKLWLRITEIGGKTVQALTGKPHGYSATQYLNYNEVIVTPPPPVVDAVTLDIVLHDVKVTGDEYKAVGVKAIKTA